MEQPCCVLDSAPLPDASREGQRTLPKKSWQGGRESARSSRAGEGQSERLCVREEPAGRKHSVLPSPQHGGLRPALLRAPERWQPKRSSSHSEQPVRQRRAPDTRVGVFPEVGVGASVVLTRVPKLSVLCEEVRARQPLRLSVLNPPPSKMRVEVCSLGTAPGVSGSGK